MILPYSLLRPLFFRFDAERAHRLTIQALKWRLAGGSNVRGTPVSIAGLRLVNAVGLAAGFDKDAEVVDGLLRLGFGFVEVGGVTPRPQPGNPGPRVFRLTEDLAVINRYGLNSAGAETVASNLAKPRRAGVVGVNLGANKESDDRIGDYAEVLKVVGHTVDFATVNVSSPNTPGLRNLQGKRELTEIFQRLHAAQATAGLSVPLFLKLAPDLAEQDILDICDIASDIGVAALVLANTTIARPNSLQSRHAHEVGGLSGAPLMGPSTALLHRFAERLDGTVPLIGVGGILSGADAQAKIDAGASAVQIYSGMVYRGPELVGECVRALATG